MQNAPHAAEAALVQTVSDLMDAYLADRRNPFAERPCKNPASLEYHLRATRALWGAMPLPEFAQGSKQRVKAKCQEWRASGLSPFTVRKRISILKTVFRFAVEEEMIARGDEPIIKLPQNGTPRERCLDAERELPLLLAAADEMATPDHLRLLIELALRTGQRRGCILDLRWEHVDFEQRVIRFRDTEEAGKRTKKRRGNKPMDDALHALLQRAHDARDEECDHVISWRGKRVRNPYHGLKAVYARAGLAGLRTHDLRRSSATFVHAELAGDMQTAANHINDTVATAAKHYVIHNPSVDLPAINAVANVMERARGSA
jgi:integrase